MGIIHFVPCILIFIHTYPDTGVHAQLHMYSVLTLKAKGKVIVQKSKKK